MSVKAGSWAAYTPLRGAEYKILIILAEKHNGKTGQCNPKIATLVKDSGYSQGQVSQALDTLEYQRYLTRHKIRQGRKNGLQYNLHIDGKVDLESKETFAKKQDEKGKSIRSDTPDDLSAHRNLKADPDLLVDVKVTGHFEVSVQEDLQVSAHRNSHIEPEEEPEPRPTVPPRTNGVSARLVSGNGLESEDAIIDLGDTHSQPSQVSTKRNGCDDPKCTNQAPIDDFSEDQGPPTPPAESYAKDFLGPTWARDSYDGQFGSPEVDKTEDPFDFGDS